MSLLLYCKCGGVVFYVLFGGVSRGYCEGHWADEAVTIHLKSLPNTPALKQPRFKCDASQNFEYVVRFLRRRLKVCDLLSFSPHLSSLSFSIAEIFVSSTELDILVFDFLSVYWFFCLWSFGVIYLVSALMTRACCSKSLWYWLWMMRKQVKDHESVCCYINSVFAPGLDEGIGNLWRVCVSPLLSLLFFLSLFLSLPPLPLLLSPWPLLFSLSPPLYPISPNSQISDIKKGEMKSKS